jgi:uncharacterized RDD family membrane protein YckC
MYEFDVIETPENVELQRRLAGIGTRFIAGLVDHLLIVGALAILLIVYLVAGYPIDPGPDSIPQGLVIALFLVAAFLVLWGYFIAFELAMNGQTPGKRAVRIRVVKEGGGPITFPDIAARNLLRIVDGLFIYGVAGVVMFLTKRGQRLGDMVGGTVVISEDTPDYSARSDKRRTVRLDEPVDADALRRTGLSAREFQVLNNYAGRRTELTLEARRRILPGLLRSISGRDDIRFEEIPLEVLEGHVDRLLAGDLGGGLPEEEAGP